MRPPFTLLCLSVILAVPTGISAQDKGPPRGLPGFMQKLVKQFEKLKGAVTRLPVFTPRKGHGTVFGVVVDAEGKPLADARFILGSLDSLETSAAFDKSLTRSNAKGEFEFRLKAPVGPKQTKERVYLLVVAENRVALRVKLPTVRYSTHKAWRHAETATEKHAVRGLDVLARVWGRTAARQPRGTVLKKLVLRPGVRLRGRVIDSAGKPVAGVRVTAQDLLTQSWFRGITKKGDHYSYAKTRMDGTFELPGVFPTGSLISTAKTGYFKSSTPVVGTKAPVELHIQRSAKVRGKLIGQDDLPATGQIRVHYEVSTTTYSEKVGKDGVFEFELRHPHRFRLVVSPTSDSAKLHSKTFSPILSGRQVGLLIKLGLKKAKPKKNPKAKSKKKPAVKLGFPISVVKKHSGMPLLKFKAGTVWVSSYRANDEAYMISRARNRLKSNKQPGYIRVQPPISSGQLDGGVVVQAKGYATHVTRLRWEQDMEPRILIEMVPESILSGVVSDARTGKPIPSVSVRCNAYSSDRTRSRMQTCRTYKSGRYRFEGMPAGYYELSVNYKNRVANTYQVDLRPEEKRGDLDFLVKSGTSVVGRITGIEIGKNWHAELITDSLLRQIRQSPGYRPTVPKVLLGEDGKFKFDDVRPGFYEVCVHIPQDARKGIGLRILLEPIRVRGGLLNLEIDASADKPAKIRGKIIFAGLEIDPERLLVVANIPNPQNIWSYSYRTNIDLNGSRSQVGADGSFEVDVVSGAHNLIVIDVLTGVQLFETRAPVEVEAGAVVSRDVQLTLVAVRVKIKPKEEGGSTAASWLDIDVELPRPEMMKMVFFSSSTNKKPSGVSLIGHRGELDLVLPAYKTVLRVRSDALRLARDTKQQGSAGVLGESELVPEPGKVNEIEIEIEVPLTGPEPEGPPEPKPEAGGKDPKSKQKAKADTAKKKAQASESKSKKLQKAPKKLPGKSK